MKNSPRTPSKARRLIAGGLLTITGSTALGACSEVIPQTTPDQDTSAAIVDVTNRAQESFERLDNTEPDLNGQTSVTTNDGVAYEEVRDAGLGNTFIDAETGLQVEESIGDLSRNYVKDSGIPDDQDPIAYQISVSPGESGYSYTNSGVYHEESPRIEAVVSRNGAVKIVDSASTKSAVAGVTATNVRKADIDVAAAKALISHTESGNLHGSTRQG
jgi:hypothetical protein